MSVETEEMKTALTMMKLIYHSENAIKDGNTSTQEEVFLELKKKMKKISKIGVDIAQLL